MQPTISALLIPTELVQRKLQANPLDDQFENLSELPAIDRTLMLELLNKCGTPLFVKNRNHQLLMVNDALCELVGFKQSEMIGKTDFDLYSKEEAEEFMAGDEQVFLSRIETEYEEVITNTQKVSKRLRTIKNVYETEDGELLLVGTLHDITELRTAQNKLEEAINHLSVVAMTDGLTGLSNRSQFEQDIEDAIEELGDDGIFSLMFIDLNGFKVINDTAGHHVGDRILQICAERLQNVFRGDSKIARVGGDEFLALLPGVDENTAVPVIERVIDTFSDPINIDGSRWQVGCSIGVSLFPRDGKVASELMRNADFAMYEAKKKKPNQNLSRTSSFEFFQSQIGKSMARRSRIEYALNFADNSNKIEQYYQPIVRRSPHTSQFEIVGFESLARWELEGQRISPEEFIPSLEQSGGIVPFGYQVIESACRYIAERCKNNEFVSVNLTYKQILEPDFCDRVASSIRNAGIDPCQLALELTEQNASIEKLLATSVLMNLRSIGVKTMLDDFGSGFSNLSRLRELPIDVVKIDKSILWQDLQLLNSVLKLIKSLNFTTIIEGVETAAQSNSVEAFGGDMMQGYFFGKPEAESFEWDALANDDPIGVANANHLRSPNRSSNSILVD